MSAKRLLKLLQVFTAISLIALASGCSTPADGWEDPAYYKGGLFVWDAGNSTYAELTGSGEAGPQGPQGIQGIQGVQGNQGSQGIQGDPGPNNITTTTSTDLNGILVGNGTFVSSITNNSANWDIAYDWGNHSLAGYLITETDPIVKALTGIIVSSGTAISSITDSSSNWDTAYTDRLKWDGGDTGLVAATGRTSLGLGSVENTALSTWAGTTNITTLGTVTTGTLQNVTLQGTISAGTGLTMPTFTLGGTVQSVGMPIGTRTASITFVIDNAGSAITTGQKGHLEVPFACNIQAVTMEADAAGAIVVDIWKDTYVNFPPTDADSITSSTPPTITATNQKSQDNTLTNWNLAVNAGDILAYNVDSCTTITRVTISLKVVKT